MLCRSTRTALTLAVVACLVGSARADEGARDATGVVVREVDLTGYRVPAAPPGPRMSIPPDLLDMHGDATDPSIWNVDWASESGTWLAFEEPHLEGRVFSPDAAIELLQLAIPPETPGLEDLDIGFADEALVLRGPAAAVEAARKAVPWVLAALAPSLTIDAALATTLPGEPERIAAVGRARLWPDRWTRVYLQENEVPCTVHWDIEVAQEATTMDPRPMGVREGQELYMRYHPGQTRSVVEVWAGSVVHLEIVEQDLSAIRNIPEANGPGVLSFPRSGVNRVFTSLVVPAGGPAEREIRWSNEGRRQRLRLTFAAGPSAQPAHEAGSGRALLTLRAGALADALEYEARRQTTESWVERISDVLYQAGLAHEERGEAYEYDVSTMGGPSIFLVGAPGGELERTQQVVAQAERGLIERSVSLRTLLVPEPSFRRLLLGGGIRVGAPLAAEVAAAFEEAGATEGEAVHTPALLGVRTGFRVGRSVPGVVDVDAEIAQASAGLHPTTSARFAGVFGEVRVRRAGEGQALWVRGELTWANAAAGSMDLAFRTPVSMRGVAEGLRVAAEAPRKVSVPVLGGGSAPVETEVELSAEDGAEHLVQAHVRGDVVVLLLARVR